MRTRNRSRGGRGRQRPQQSRRKVGRDATSSESESSESEDSGSEFRTPKNNRASDQSPKGRSSERIRERRNREFHMPSREDLFENIEALKSPEKRVTRRSLVGNFTRETHSYNQDRLSNSDVSSVEEFINDDEETSYSEEEEGEEASQVDNTRKRKLSVGTRIIQRSSSSSDEETLVRPTSKWRRLKRDDTSSSEDDAPVPTGCGDDSDGLPDIDQESKDTGVRPETEPLTEDTPHSEVKQHPQDGSDKSECDEVILLEDNAVLNDNHKGVVGQQIQQQPQEYQQQRQQRSQQQHGHQQQQHQQQEQQQPQCQQKSDVLMDIQQEESVNEKVSMPSSEDRPPREKAGTSLAVASNQGTNMEKTKPELAGENDHCNSKTAQEDNPNGLSVQDIDNVSDEEIPSRRKANRSLVIDSDEDMLITGPGKAMQENGSVCKTRGGDKQGEGSDSDTIIDCSDEEMPAHRKANRSLVIDSDEDTVITVPGKTLQENNGSVPQPNGGEKQGEGSDSDTIIDCSDEDMPAHRKANRSLVIESDDELETVEPEKDKDAEDVQIMSTSCSEEDSDENYQNGENDSEKTGIDQERELQSEGADDDSGASSQETCSSEGSESEEDVRGNSKRARLMKSKKDAWREKFEMYKRVRQKSASKEEAVK